jgi:hypothetical protein
MIDNCRRMFLFLLLLVVVASHSDDQVDIEVVDESLENRSAPELGVSADDVVAVHNVLARLKAPNVCFERVEHQFWTYAYCPALAHAPLRQYHAGDRQQAYTHLNAKQKYALGDRLDAFQVSSKYLSLFYSGGDRCDDGTPRAAEVRLACNPALRGTAHGAIVEVAEVKKCSYRITLETRLTCALRFFAAQTDSSHTTKATLATTSVRASSTTLLPPTPGYKAPAPTQTQTQLPRRTIGFVDMDEDEADAMREAAPPLQTYEHTYDVRRVPRGRKPRASAVAGRKSVWSMLLDSLL